MNYLAPCSLSLFLLAGPALSSTGHCPDGSKYILTKTTIEVSGRNLPLFVYEGPLGKGEVQSSVDLETARQLVCRVDKQARWLDDEQRDD